mmetsp:Transcript_19724/g.28371  ORF Transcript_19724/g.28371 Transcript_19724/m.28371 type:complete len:85 (-) Transcript_19724:110-364(-)
MTVMWIGLLWRNISMVLVLRFSAVHEDVSYRGPEDLQQKENLRHTKGMLQLSMLRPLLQQQTRCRYDISLCNAVICQRKNKLRR